jgi:23S rRNA (cytosine1962-C5)-methyltransferase
MRFLARAARRGERYGAVVCDPPSFARTGRGRGAVFAVERAYPELARAVLALLAPGGEALLACNCARMPAARFRDLVRTAARSCGGRFAIDLQRGAAPLDFPPPPGEAPPLKVIRARSNPRA